MDAPKDRWSLNLQEPFISYLKRNCQRTIRKKMWITFLRDFSALNGFLEIWNYCSHDPVNPNNSRKPLYHICLSKHSLVQECLPGSTQPGNEVACPPGLADRLTKGETAHKDHLKLNQAASFQPNQENFSILSGWPCIYNSSSVEWAY